MAEGDEKTEETEKEYLERIQKENLNKKTVDFFLILTAIDRDQEINMASLSEFEYVRVSRCIEFVKEMKGLRAKCNEGYEENKALKFQLNKKDDAIKLLEGDIESIKNRLEAALKRTESKAKTDRLQRSNREYAAFINDLNSEISEKNDVIEAQKLIVNQLKATCRIAGEIAKRVCNAAIDGAME